jgi:Leucine-rich repeat (LRR) protein
MTKTILPVRDRAPLLLSNTQWVQKEALSFMSDVTKANVANLNDEQKKRYVELHRKALKALEAVEAENKRLKDAFKTTHLAILKRELKILTGVEVDPEQARIQTLYREFKEGHSPLDLLTGTPEEKPGSTPDPGHSKRAVDESRYVDHPRSMSLWDAACRNFGYRTDSVLAQPYSYEEASHIEYGELPGKHPVKPFIELVRRLDFGSALSLTLDQAMGSDGSLTRLVGEASKAGFEFELLEALRDSAVSGITQVAYQRLRNVFNDEIAYEARPLLMAHAPHAIFGTSTALPLVLIRFSGEEGTFSYFPQRLGGALRYHEQGEQAIKQFKQQLIDAHRAGQLGWFARQLPLNELDHFRNLLSPEPRPTGMSWLAGVLYDGFHKAFPEPSLENLRLHAEPLTERRRSLVDLLVGRQTQRYRADLRMLATTRSEADWEAFKEAALTLGNEVLSMLTTPMPGGVLGLNRIMQAAIFGSLAHSIVQGVIEASKGEGSTFASALADTADLLISARLTGVAGKVHRQRMHNLWTGAGKPRKVTLANGKIELRPPAPDIAPEQQALKDSQGLSDAGLLQRMLPVDTPASALKSIERMLSITATSREQLQAVWQGKHIPGPLAEGARRLQIDRLIDQIIADVPQRGEMPLNAEGAVFALLTQLEHWPADAVLDVFNQQGQLIETYGKRYSAGMTLSRIEVKRLDHGAYVARGDVTQGSSRVEELFSLILEQLPATSILGREENFALGLTARIARMREQIAQLADTDRHLLFKALTGLDGHTRNDPVAFADPANKYLPLVRPPISQTTTPLLAKLHELNPSLPIESLEPLVDTHPFSPSQERRALEGNAVPAAFAQAADQLKMKLRVDGALDGIYHSRVYQRDCDLWAREFAGGVLNDTLKRRLVVTDVSAQTQSKPYVSSGSDDPTVELLYYGDGIFKASDFRNGGTIPVAPPRDSFYLAIGSVLQPHERSALGMNSDTDASGLRETVGDAMLAQRQPNGEVNLWDRSTAQYERTVRLPRDQPPGELGLYEMDGQKFLSLYGSVYRVDFDPAFNKWRMLHPDKVGVNTPVLEHNGHGAWRQAIENPLQWEGLQLLRRLRAEPITVSDEMGRRIMQVSNTEEGVLRQVHVNNLAPPPLLVDTWKRFRIEEKIQTFTNKLQKRNTLGEANGDLQLLLLQSLPGWPGDKVLQVVDAEGKTLQEYGSELPSEAPRIKLTVDETRNGSLLRTLLSRLNESNTRGLLGEYNPVIEQRMFTLAQKIAGYALKRKADVFGSLYKTSEYSDEPHVVLLQKSYPELPKSVIENLLRFTTGDEKSNFLDQGLIPPRLAEQIQWTAHKVRLTRAYEGLFLGAAATPDSERLTLRMLQALPGWPATVRIEVRHDEVGGEVFDSIGPQEGASVRTLVKRGDQYAAYSPDGLALNSESGTDNNLLSSILSVLDDTERAAVGVADVSDVQVLAAKIEKQAIRHRANVEVLLGLQPPREGRKPPMKVDSSFVAYPLFLPSDVRANLAMHRDVHNLYPRLDADGIHRFLESLGETEAIRQAAVMRLRQELNTLQEQLGRWEAVRFYTSYGGSVVSVSPNTRALVKERIIRAWRRETDEVPAQQGGSVSYILDLSGYHSGDLPRLAADFSHVTVLDMSDMDLHWGSTAFLSRFPRLQVLSLSGNPINSLPVAIASLTQLTALNLRSTELVLTAQNVHELAGLTALRNLDLSYNPLRLAPDVGQMTQLRRLDLSNAQLEDWPVGLMQLSNIQRVDLRVNRISTIPQAVFDGPVQVARTIRLHGNPLSDESEQRLAQYRVRTGITLGVMHAGAHAPDLPARVVSDISPWLSASFSPEQEAQKREQWRQLRQFKGQADRFFAMLSQLVRDPQRLSSQDLRQLQQRVWTMIEQMLADTELRRKLLEMPYDQTCMDGARVQFDEREVEVLVHNANYGSDDTANREVQLFKLARGRFRLRQVDSIAEMQEARQFASGQEPDWFEIQQYMRIKLAQDLELPIATREMVFERLGRVPEPVLTKAKNDVLAMDNTPAYINALLDESFWREYLLKAHSDQFKPIDDWYLQEEENLDKDRAEGRIPQEQRDNKAAELAINREQKINHLIEQLTERARQVADGLESPDL